MNMENTKEIQQNPPEGAQTQQNPSEGTSQETKHFTQDDVNRIVGERLAKERAKLETELASREAQLRQKELEFTAKEMLKKHDLPESLIPALNGTDEETLQKSIEIVCQAYEEKQKKPPVPRVLGAAQTIKFGSPENTIKQIEKAMNLTR